MHFKVLHKKNRGNFAVMRAGGVPTSCTHFVVANCMFTTASVPHNILILHMYHKSGHVN